MIGWPRGARGRGVFLLVSLALNLFLGGTLIGRVTGQAAQESQTRRSIQAMLAPLPDAKRELVRKEIAIVMPVVRQRFADLQKMRASLAEEMVKPSPDSAALERGFAEIQTQTTAIGAELQKAMVRALPLLSQEERRAMTQALLQRRSGGALPLP